MELEAVKIIKSKLKIPLSQRTFYDYLEITNQLKTIKYFKMKNLAHSELALISKSLFYSKVKRKEMIFDYKSFGDGFYIILSGSVSVQIPIKDDKRPAVLRSKKDEFLEVAILETGTTFGELAILTGKRSARIVACEKSCFAVLPNKCFLRVLKKKEESRLNLLAKFLIATPYFKRCKPRIIYFLDYYFIPKIYNRGQEICRRGDAITDIILVKEGEFEVKMMACKPTDKREEMKIRRGEDLKLKVKKGAIGVGRMLKGIDEKKYYYIDNGVINYGKKTSIDDMMEVSVRKLGRGEMFGQSDLICHRNSYTATLKCTTMKGEAYLITKDNFNRFVKILPGVLNYLRSEVRILNERINEFVEIYQRMKNYPDSIPTPESETENILENMSNLNTLQPIEENLFNFDQKSPMGISGIGSIQPNKTVQAPIANIAQSHFPSNYFKSRNIYTDQGKHITENNSLNQSKVSINQNILATSFYIPTTTEYNQTLPNISKKNLQKVNPELNTTQYLGKDRYAEKKKEVIETPRFNMEIHKKAKESSENISVDLHSRNNSFNKTKNVASFTDHISFNTKEIFDLTKLNKSQTTKYVLEKEKITSTFVKYVNNAPPISQYKRNSCAFHSKPKMLLNIKDKNSSNTNSFKQFSRKITKDIPEDYEKIFKQHLELKKRENLLKHSSSQPIKLLHKVLRAKIPNKYLQDLEEVQLKNKIPLKVPIKKEIMGGGFIHHPPRSTYHAQALSKSIRNRRIQYNSVIEGENMSYVSMKAVEFPFSHAI